MKNPPVPVKTPDTSDVYLHVTTDVLNKILCNFREELLSQGIKESIIDHLQAIWELKMVRCGVVQQTTKGIGQDEIDECERLYAPMFDSPSRKGTVSDSGAGSADMQTGLLAVDMQQPSPLDLNAAYEERREERGVKPIPKTESRAKDNLPKDYIPQQDGCNNLSAQEVDHEEAPINENDDDEDDMEDWDEAPPNLVLAQYTKVGKKKHIWKCMFKDGIMHLNNRDILFSTATGEFDF